MSFFFILMKKRRLSRPYLVKNRKFCQNYTIFLAKKVDRMHFFPIFHEKISPLMPIFFKNTYIPKTTAFIPIFCQQNVHALKNTLLSCHIFKIFYETPLHVMPIFGQQNVNSVKTTLYYRLKSQQAALFSDFSRKSTCSHALILL